MKRQPFQPAVKNIVFGGEHNDDSLVIESLDDSDSEGPLPQESESTNHIDVNDESLYDLSLSFINRFRGSSSSSVGKIDRIRVAEEVARIKQRFNSSKNSATNKDLILNAFSLDVPKVARRFIQEISDNSNNLLNSLSGSGTITSHGKVKAQFQISPFLTLDYSFSASGREDTVINKSESRSVDDEDRLFSQVLEEIERCRNRIIYGYNTNRSPPAGSSSALLPQLSSPSSSKNICSDREKVGASEETGVGRVEKYISHRSHGMMAGASSIEEMEVSVDSRPIPLVLPSPLSLSEAAISIRGCGREREKNIDASHEESLELTIDGISSFHYSDDEFEDDGEEDVSHFRVAEHIAKVEGRGISSDHNNSLESAGIDSLPGRGENETTANVCWGVSQSDGEKADSGMDSSRRSVYTNRMDSSRRNGDTNINRSHIAAEQRGKSIPTLAAELSTHKEDGAPENDDIDEEGEYDEDEEDGFGYNDSYNNNDDNDQVSVEVATLSATGKVRKKKREYYLDVLLSSVSDYRDWRQSSLSPSKNLSTDNKDSNKSSTSGAFTASTIPASSFNQDHNTAESSYSIAPIASVPTIMARGGTALTVSIGTAPSVVASAAGTRPSPLLQSSSSSHEEVHSPQRMQQIEQQQQGQRPSPSLIRSRLADALKAGDVAGSFLVDLVVSHPPPPVHLAHKTSSFSDREAESVVGLSTQPQRWRP